jgi:pyruvate formate lyase activating enzyme
VNEARCVDCGFCQSTLYCASPEACIGCGVCVQGCPYQARELVPDDQPREMIHISVDGQRLSVPERITIKRALELAARPSGPSREQAPSGSDGGEQMTAEAKCGSGGCYNCTVFVTDQPEHAHPDRTKRPRRRATRACVTPIRDGMAIETSPATDAAPRRIIHGPQGHAVGGKGTPWWLKAKRRYIEVAIWTAGCNLRCPQCQNFAVTYDGTSQPMTAQQAAELVTHARQRYGVDRMAISGGEATLNRPWLVAYFQALKALNPASQARLHLDSNGTLLTRDYIDELVLEAGVTDIGIEPKAVQVSTFQRITSIRDADLVRRYLETAWEAVEYVAATYHDRVFLGVVHHQISFDSMSS